MKGWVKVHRAIREHWLYSKKPFCAAFAFIDLVLRASHSNTEMSFDSKVIVVKRGHFVTSQTALASAWGWSRNKVQRFLRLLERAQMIEQAAGRRSTIIRICNYDLYQDVGTTGRAETRTTGGRKTSASRAASEQLSADSGADPGQIAGTIKNGKNDKNSKNGKNVCVSSTHGRAEPVRFEAGAQNDESPASLNSDSDCVHHLESEFEKPHADAPWIRDPQYVNAGRRPLKLYPLMFLTPRELERVFDELRDAGIPPNKFTLVFSRVDARLRTYRAQGKELAQTCAYNSLIGWAKAEVVRELRDTCDLKRSQAYLANA